MAGFLAPGDRVDLILSMVIQPADKTASPRHVSETVLTDLRVLGSDQKLVDDQKEITAPKTVTLEVTPKQAEIVAVVSEMGLLSISLRSLAADAAPAPPAITRTWDKDAIDLRAPASMAKGDSRAQPRVIVVRGSEVSEVAMGATGAAAVKP
jgi:pilus assembly protein CpaB